MEPSSRGQTSNKEWRVNGLLSLLDQFLFGGQVDVAMDLVCIVLWKKSFKT
jgi:hypothetical protein